MSLVAACSHLVRSHLSGVAVAWVATFMAVFGGDISRVVRRAVRTQVFLVRVGVFLFLVVFGYGALALLAGTLLARVLGTLNNAWLAPVVALGFLTLAVVAEERRQL